jgi:hypothetical protein
MSTLTIHTAKAGGLGIPGFEVSARIDREHRVWYGAMKIPYSAIDPRPAAAGNFLRANVFRSPGAWSKSSPGHLAGSYGGYLPPPGAF